MAYTAPTTAELKAHFPAFAAVDDAVVQYNITRANRMVDANWTEGDYATAIELLACHYMTLAGFGTGADAQVNAQGMGAFSLIRSGNLTLQRSKTNGGADSGVPAQFAGSVYGEQFYALLRVNRPGVAVAGGTDVPLDYPAGWPAWPWP